MILRNVFIVAIIAIAHIIPMQSYAVDNSIPTGVQILKEGTTYDLTKAPGHLVVIDFNATWCGPCRKFSPIFKSAADKYKGEVEFISVDIDRHKKLTRDIGITSVPTLLFICSDGKIYSWVGLLPQEEFFKAIDKLKSGVDD